MPAEKSWHVDQSLRKVEMWIATRHVISKVFVTNCDSQSAVFGGAGLHVCAQQEEDQSGTEGVRLAR